jgi:pyrroline-5-carboxylate reductase
MAAQTGGETRFGFIGAGRMATALVRGLISSRFAAADRVVACDVLESACAQFSKETGARTVASVSEVFRTADVVILAVKPQQMGDVYRDAKGQATPGHLIVSIAAGVDLKSLAAGLGAGLRLVRVMPNTPCLLGAGASAFAIGGAATEADAALVKGMLATVGIAVAVPEKLLDAVTGLSGSGPAYVYQFIEALSDGGVRMGLPREVATRLAAQTVLGSARMVLETGQHPGSLKDAVASPGGTTIAGLHELERGGLRGCVMNAVEAATVRSKELGQSS